MGMSGRTASLTVLAMLAFSANSILCRMALGAGDIDPASFSSIRLMSGAAMLGFIVLARHYTTNPTPSPARVPPRWTALALFVYAALFSFAYITLSTGTGALILFGAVQLTMFIAAILKKESFSHLAKLGLAIAVAGLVYLISPGITAPDPISAILMAIAGVAWGMYSLWGREVSDPLMVTAKSFALAVPLAITLSLLNFNDIALSHRGIWLAMLSGSITSGCGYVVWYAALRGLSASSAATVQLSVPVLAAIGGIILLSEPLTWRLTIASTATLGGVALVLAQKSNQR